jgi:phage regulator Rha-like protein
MDKFNRPPHYKINDERSLLFTDFGYMTTYEDERKVYASWFRIGNQTFFLQTVEDTETAKFYVRMLIKAFDKLGEHHENKKDSPKDEK